MCNISFCSETASSRKRARLSLVIDFDSLEGTNVFKRRLDYVREVLTPAGQSDLDNCGLISAIFDHMERLFLPASFSGIERANTQSLYLSLTFIVFLSLFDSAMYKCSTAIKVVTYYYQACN